VCQNEFDGISKDNLELSAEEMEGKDKEEVDYMKNKKKQRCIATMKFIGELFLTKMLTARIIGGVIQDLAQCQDVNVNPPEHVLECICTLLNSIGYTLDNMPAGHESMTQVCGRLLDLKQKKTKKGKEHYSKRVQFMIQDLIDTKNSNWQKKVFKQAAKTKEQIREDAKRDEKTQKTDGSEVVVAGQRPAWMTESKGGSSGGPSADAGGEWDTVTKPSKKR